MEPSNRTEGDDEADRRGETASRGGTDAGGRTASRADPDRRGEYRRVTRIGDLERRIERLEGELAWLRRVVRSDGEATEREATGPCPNCSRGVLVGRRGELRCSACGYSRFL